MQAVGTSDQRDFLPFDAPFAQAANLYQAAFPDPFTPSSDLIVLTLGSVLKTGRAAGS